ncbi:2-keto-4-pentenoate hydratase [Crossiella sp. CA198]|uniref:2-keto-4-pentenoate hydratase n=1 Tax=Crossiella sp. CA198 TaxID=3455607 RepID=UPI003F8D46CF
MNADIVKAADALAEAARTGLACPPVRSLFAEGDVTAAYAVQRVNVAAAVTAGRRITGRKIGLTNPAVQRQLGVDQPDFGALFADTEVGDRGVVEPGRLLQPKVEAEVALILDQDLPGTEYRPEDIRRAVRYALPALEIVDSRIAGWDISFVDTVADNASAGLYVLGTPVPLGELDLRTVLMSMRRNGKEVSTGIGANCLDDPLIAAAWLANTLAALGDPVRAGDVVLTGALGPVVNAVPGDHFGAEISGLGGVSVHFGQPEGDQA